MIILAIETSCDETAAAVLKDKKILSNIVFSQEKIHAQYGGIVPEVAARRHVEIIIPTISQALTAAKIKKEEIDALAVTFGPGLITSLIIGVETAKSLAFALKKPLIPVNHLEGHIYANFIINQEIADFSLTHAKQNNLGSTKKNKQTRINFNHLPLFPLLCLIVSGGHTELVFMPRHLEYKLLGETRDDAAGECFDKVAKLLNLGYPGGPVISQRAKRGNPYAFNFPRPMIKSNDFDFSFSGLKTAVLRLIKKQIQTKNEKTKGLADFSLRQKHKLRLTTPNNPKVLAKTKDKNLFFSSQEINDICASFQAAVCEVLISKTISAAKKYHPKTIALAGGVSANKFLRKKMAQEIKKHLPKTRYLIPEIKYCQDNAAMIAAAAYFKLQAGKKTTWQKIKAEANAKL